MAPPLRATFLSLILIACGPRAETGALGIHGVPGQGELYLDAMARGPIAAEQVFEGLAPGPHLVELVQGPRVLASARVEVRAGMIFRMRLEAPPVALEPPSPVVPDPLPALDPPAAPPVRADATVAVPPSDPASSASPVEAPAISPAVDHSEGDFLVLAGIDPLKPPAPRGLARPRVRAGLAEIHGALSPAQVRSVVRRGIEPMRGCYERELLEHPELGGRIVLEITIAEAGNVQRAWVSSTQLPRSRVEACIADVAERWRFPPSRDGRTVVVDQALVLDR